MNRVAVENKRDLITFIFQLIKRLCNKTIKPFVIAIWRSLIVLFFCDAFDVFIVYHE